MQPAIKMALRVVRQGSDYLKAHFERQSTYGKDEGERRRQLERMEQSIYDNFKEQLEKAYKDHHIAPLNESDAGEHEKSWHIFPLLGRDNFLRGLPEFALALAQKKQNRTENLLIVQPITGEEYSASRGHGAALNSRRVRTSEIRQISQSAIATNLLDQARHSEHAPLWGEMAAMLAHDAALVRSSGCVLLDIARVAAGNLDAAVVFRPEPVDLALGVPLAMESGALTGDFSGNPSTDTARHLVTANPKLFREVLKTLHPFRARLPR
ncbi:inositol monophosphatase family protein [Marinobacter lutaoensis]|jgi:myo-inositol-1(or 4)-monophosphatase|uniref:Inositol monophosphatase n=1 Tax=Marinobacter lutaoensis TaxID=135739 RepID=A0A1V2DUX2_9GAMM|nr:inositol monophosphatase family protein [Marinobacter lutaoensis]MBI42124.1 inositol monophosphatase [Oceanospirillales bacterium]NVD35062.1 inositol monophosphatase [Marinobacter lutaoensis]ONF44270.1 inositol monophosphatase [Marinobacter lutaoensis]|tara:strand:+ start:744 stop:1544 length:801 start_codon:yes stop_codon:yes gene_type:complete